MKQRKNYEAPTMEVVELKMLDNLLTSSDVNSTSIEDGKLNNFDADWE